MKQLNPSACCRPLLLAALLLPLLLPAQRLRTARGEYQLNLSRSALSEADACRQCKEIAMVQALEAEFGRVMVQGNSTWVQNTQTGEQVQTEQIFSMIAETFVNGDWVRTQEESCERFVENGEFWLRCAVKGQVQELARPRMDLTVKPLRCEDPGCETTVFKDGDPLYLNFKSPSDGYVSVYLAGPETVQRLLPYRDMPEGQAQGVRIKGDRAYTFFSRSLDRLDLYAYVDEYEMFAENEQDQNRLIVIFTEAPLDKPVLLPGAAGSTPMPMELTSVQFQKWLAAQRRHQPEMQVARVDLLIQR
ncbi:MAG: hypothetical protein NW241_22400 [Bacteroidia bacterium]|nr:hypothetical protein [Bacteroidia bacterium]